MNTGCGIARVEYWQGETSWRCLSCFGCCDVRGGCSCKVPPGGSPLGFCKEVAMTLVYCGIALVIYSGPECFYCVAGQE